MLSSMENDEVLSPFLSYVFSQLVIGRTLEPGWKSAGLHTAIEHVFLTHIEHIEV